MLNQHHFLRLGSTSFLPAVPATRRDAPQRARRGRQESKFKINILILRRKICPLTLGLASYNYSLLGKPVENLAHQKQKITPSLLYLYQNRRLHFKQNLPFYRP